MSEHIKTGGEIHREVEQGTSHFKCLSDETFTNQWVSLSWLKEQILGEKEPGKKCFIDADYLLEILDEKEDSS